MWNEPSEEELRKLPKLYETEKVSLEEKLIHMHFFIGGCDWYVSEYDHPIAFSLAMQSSTTTSRMQSGVTSVTMSCATFVCENSKLIAIFIGNLRGL